MDDANELLSLAELLRGLAGGTGILGTGLQVALIAIESAAAFAAGGKDPVAEIQRIHSADPELQRMRGEWDERINKRFPDS